MACEFLIEIIPVILQQLVAILIYCLMRKIYFSVLKNFITLIDLWESLRCFAYIYTRVFLEFIMSCVVNLVSLSKNLMSYVTNLLSLWKNFKKASNNTRRAYRRSVTNNALIGPQQGDRHRNSK